MNSKTDGRESKKYSGVIVPMVTPFTSDGEIDEHSVGRITDYIVTRHASPFVLGTTGESASISDKKRIQVVHNMVQAADGRTVTYAGISSNSFDASIQAASVYFDLGVDVVVAHLPGYYAINADDMLFYFELLLKNISGPLILYNITSVTHLSIPLDVIEKLSYHEQVMGVKDSERDLERMKKALKMWAGRSDFSYLIGWGTQMYFGLQHGADGLVPSSGNVVPRLYDDLYTAALKGSNQKAPEMQKIADAVSAIYQKERSLGQSLAALKVMMHELKLCQPYMLPPLRELAEEERQMVIDAMYPFRSYFEYA